MTCSGIPQVDHLDPWVPMAHLVVSPLVPQCWVLVPPEVLHLLVRPRTILIQVQKCPHLHPMALSMG